MADIGVSDGVRVNAINPGLMETDRFTRNVERVMRDRSLLRDDALAFVVSSYGTRRVGRPEEIGQSVAYHAGCHCRYRRRRESRALTGEASDD